MMNALIRNETGYDAEISEIRLVHASPHIIAADAHITAVSALFPSASGSLFQLRDPVVYEAPGDEAKPGTVTFTSALLTGIVSVEGPWQTTYQATLSNAPPH